MEHDKLELFPHTSIHNIPIVKSYTDPCDTEQEYDSETYQIGDNEQIIIDGEICKSNEYFRRVANGDIVIHWENSIDDDDEPTSDDDDDNVYDPKDYVSECYVSDHENDFDDIDIQYLLSPDVYTVDDENETDEDYYEIERNAHCIDHRGKFLKWGTI